MPGIYIHIPFCKQACHYCNFHFSTSLKYKEEMLEALLSEMEFRRDYLSGKTIDTIYFGGGTPSLLSQAELERLFTKIYQLHPIAEGAEITLEANPDDLIPEKLEELKQTPVNRLSIGIQSFYDVDLRFMNRAHNAREASSCIENARAAGFENLTIDLIYGAPTTGDAQWKKNIQRTLDFEVPHLSCYCLTVEPGTALGHFVKTGKVPPVDEERAARQFELLMEKMNVTGYEHYEISNFARPACYSRHNSSYWRGEAYLGIGPSAHSYNGQSRQWNIANNAKYIKLLRAAQRDPPSLAGLYELETLTPTQHYNEYVMTSLRTIWGCRLNGIAAGFQTHFLEKVQAYLDSGHVQQHKGVFTLSDKGKLLADHIAAELFLG